MKKFAFSFVFLPLLFFFITALFAQSQVSITVVNNTGYEVYNVYISPSTSSHWGEDRLPWNQTLRNNQSVSLQLPDPRQNRYDIRLIDLDGDSYTKSNVQVSANARIVFTFDDFDRGQGATAQQPQQTQQSRQQDLDPLVASVLQNYRDQQAQRPAQPQQGAANSSLVDSVIQNHRERQAQPRPPSAFVPGIPPVFQLESGEYRYYIGNNASDPVFVDAERRTMRFIFGPVNSPVFVTNPTYEISGYIIRFTYSDGGTAEGQVTSSTSFTNENGHYRLVTSTSGGSSGGGSVGSSGSSGSTASRVCPDCRGTGSSLTWIDWAPQWDTSSRTYWCDICGEWLRGHSHRNCIRCRGTGRI